MDRLTPDGIFYAGNIKPNSNIIEGMEHIVDIVTERVNTASPPVLVEKSEE